MVPPQPNRERFDEIYAESGVPANMTWHTAVNTDHMFRMTDTICFDYEGSIDNPYSEDFVAYLEGWIDTLGVSQQ